MVKKEIVKDNKSRNILSKVQSRKTCCEIQSIQSNLKKLTADTRNSFIHATVTGNSKAKRTISGSKVKQSIVEMPKYTTRPRVEVQTKKKSILKK